VQVVIAQDSDGRLAETLHESQCLQRFWPSIDQIPREPEAILFWVEFELVQ